MSVNSLIYCPEGGEHEWTLWTDESDGDLVIDCDRCHSEAYRTSFRSHTVAFNPLPVKLSQEYDQPMIVETRREV